MNILNDITNIAYESCISQKKLNCMMGCQAVLLF